MNMELFAVLLMFIMLWKPSWSLSCYKCEAEPVDYANYNIHSCRHFDYSKKYEVKCEASTMCFKRVTSLTLENGVTSKSVYRGCASQTLSGDQEFKNGKWKHVNNIYEVYDETCSDDPSDSERVTKTVNCYCRGDFCNNAHKSNTHTTLGIFSILLALLAS